MALDSAMKSSWEWFLGFWGFSLVVGAEGSRRHEGSLGFAGVVWLCTSDLLSG